MEFLTAVVSALFGFFLGLLTLWKWKKLSEKVLSKIDGRNIKKVIIKDGEIILVADAKAKMLKREKEAAEKKLEVKIKEIGCLERDFKCAWELLKKAVEAAKKSSDTTNDFI